MNKQNILQQTCPKCQAFYQLLEIHQLGLEHCTENCLQTWQKLLHQHYQEQIILFLAQQEAQKDQKNHDSK